MKKSVLLSSFLLLLLTPSVVFASPSNNPVYATIEQVQQMITSAVTSWQNQVNGLRERITELESTTQGHKHKYVLVDSSNQELGTLVDGFGIGEQKTAYNEEYKRFITLHTTCSPKPLLVSPGLPPSCPGRWVM